MRICGTLALAGILTVNAWAAHGAHQSVSPSARKAILLNYVGIDDAFHQKNLDKIYSYLTANYVFHVRGVTYSTSTLRQMQAQIFAESGAMTSTTRVQNMTLHGREVVVTIRQYVTEMLMNARDHRNEKDGFLYIEQDFWVPTPSGWRIQYTRVLSEVDTINGQPVTDTPRPDLS